MKRAYTGYTAKVSDTQVRARLLGANLGGTPIYFFHHKTTVCPITDSLTARVQN
jgi:hypothetical protein